MEPEGSLPLSQVPATCPFPKPAWSSLYPHIPLSEGPSQFIFPSAPGSPRFPHQNPVYLSPVPHTRYMPYPPHSSRFITQKIVVEEYRSLSSSLCSFLHYLVTSPLLGPNIPLNTLFLNTLNLRSSHDVSDQVSHPYKITGKL